MRTIQVIGNVAVGGAERHLLDLVEGLAERGISTEVVCPRPGPLSEKLTRRGVPVTCIEMVRPRPGDEFDLAWPAVEALSHLFAERRPDVVHSHLYPAHLHASLAAAMVGIRAVVRTAHTLIVRPGDVLLGRLIPAWTIATARAVATRLESAGVPAERMRVIYNGVGAEHLVEPEPRRLSDERERLGLREGQVVGTAVRLSPEKGVDVLLRAARVVLEATPGVTFLIAGQGPLRDDLVRLAQELGIEKRVRFLGARDDVAVLNRLLDVFVLPSREEACPMALLEAMAARRAVVATAVGGSTELVQDGLNGRLAPADNPAALAECVLDLLGAPAQGTALGEKAHQTVARDFTRERMVARTLELYAELLDVSRSCGSSARPAG